MLKEAMKNTDNKYFVLLSGDCIPLYSFNDIYNKITNSSKALMEFVKKTSKFNKKYYYSSQWVVLNRKVAQLYIDMGENLNWSLKNYEKLWKPQCPDEVLPIEWVDS